MYRTAKFPSVSLYLYSFVELNQVFDKLQECLTDKMIKLKKIITSLDDTVYKAVEGALIKTKADNFLFLLQTYRAGKLSDSEVATALGINPNSFYVLKSRLHDKIQEYLSGNIYSAKEEVLRQLHEVQAMCYSSPRELTIAFLHKLEKDLLYYDMHNELLVVYSALKKMHLYSQKYFAYSQLYNKHIAFSLSFEKSEELLGSFNISLAQYNFSRSAKLLETLLFLEKGVANHYALNPSRLIEIIKNIMECQLGIFCNTKHQTSSTEEVLLQTQKIIEALPPSSTGKCWRSSLDYLFFEYYFRMGQHTQALLYYEKVNAGLDKLLLHTNMCLSSMFLLSKICFLQQNNKTSQLVADHGKAFLFDADDTHTLVITGIYNAMILYYKGNYKEAAFTLNEILNINSFKDYFHINTEIKLTLVFFYLQLKEYDLADSILNNVYRKIKSENFDNYANVLDLIKVFAAEIKQNGGKVTAKQKDSFELFIARSNAGNGMLSYLLFELKKIYA